MNNQKTFTKSSFILAFAAVILLAFSAADLTAQSQGEALHLMVESQALAGNDIGDSSIRSVSVYLPSAYHTSAQREFPVLYLLHGFTDSNHKWFGQKDHWLNLPTLIDSLDIPTEEQFIVVMPNAYNSFQGSMYSNSSTTGNWEDFIAEELVSYIDENYRTLRKSSARGLAGHSMGGYGTMRIGLKNPDVFGALYAMSPCCLESNLPTNAGLIKNIAKVTDPNMIDEQPFFVRISLAAAAAWSPNPNKPPMYYDLPYDENGAVIDSIADRFKSNEIIANLSDYQLALQEIDKLSIDVGNQDFMILKSSESLHQHLDEMNIENHYEVYDGNHTNRIGERLGTHVLPSFAAYFKQ